MKTVLILIMTLLYFSCSIKVDESVLSQMGGNIYYNSGGFSGESIKIHKNNTFNVSASTCTASWEQFNGSWSLKSDTLILQCRNIVDPNVTDIEEIIERNYFKQLKFKVFNDGILLLFVDDIELGYRHQYFYELYKYKTD